MWQCPKCGREFKNNNQDHYCGEAPKNIDEYIAAQPEDVRPILANIRETIRAAAPNATEKISWHMPTFRQGTVQLSLGKPIDYALIAEITRWLAQQVEKR